MSTPRLSLTLSLLALGAAACGASPATKPMPPAQQIAEAESPSEASPRSAVPMSGSQSRSSSNETDASAGTRPDGGAAHRERAEATVAMEPAANGENGELVARTRADQAALERAESDYRRQRADGSLGGQEAADYAGYIAGLRRKVVEDCVALEASGAEAPTDLPCETMTAGLPSSPHSTDPGSISSGAERARELEAELQASLGEFDESLIRGQDTVSGERDGRGLDDDAYGTGRGRRSGEGRGEDGEAEADGPAEQGEQGEQGQGADGQAGAAGSRSKGQREGSSGREGDRQGRDQGGIGGAGGQGAPSAGPDTAEFEDDDVVARQLREAAENETDPELKEKLWEEYRKYKKGVS